ncbi:protoporphyrinogen/coproporphyrinogen oxidase [Pseudomonas sp. BGr12]|uniref:protoporphyrinogen/coproporphyrinogen oxidase n=1 Tax=Pseudomonas sp. BGr12 TaxID=2936269 RepID=UPI0025598221|nr:NAD(P)/FAD-dependent oxidoreductase [Pseudomonas sp. BJa5]MDL2428391.1 FAD-dependent oxidoreductase [Pseudomonas sp. BJa5]
MNKKDIIVVGAGISGLTAAFDLQKQGHKVTVLEASDITGGRMADIALKGLNIHTGATIIWDNFKDMMDLVAELGIKDKLVPYSSEDYRVNNGQSEYDIRFHFSVTNMLAHPAFSASSKLKLAKLLPDIIKSGLKTDPCLMHTAAEFDTESVADYLTDKGVTDFLENFVEPLFRAPWNWEPEEFSKAYLLTMCGHLPGSKTFTFQDGIGALTRELAKHLTIHHKSKVVSIDDNSDQACVVVVEKEGVEEVLTADLVVFTAQADRARQLVKSLSEEEAKFFDSVKYNSCGIVYYILNKPVPPDLKWFTRKHSSPVVFYAQIPEDENVPEGHVQPPHLYLELTPQVRDRAAAENNIGNLDQYARAFAKDMYPQLDENLRDVVEQWVPQMLPLWYPGYAKKVANFIENREKDPRRVYFAGDYLSQSHTGGACASGRRAARLISLHWQ